MSAPQKKKPQTVAAAMGLTKDDTANFTLTTVKAEPRADTRLLAKHLGNTHKAVMALVDRYQERLQSFGQLPFKKEVGDRAQGGGNAERFALLNEDQAFCLVALSRNTDRVVDLKVKMVAAFGDARRAAEVREAEYLPSYHAMHDAIKRAANGSPNERFMHINANKVLNQLAGVQPGQRPAAGQLQQSILAVGCAMAARAVTEAPDGHGLHQHIKTALKPLASVLLTGAVDAASAPALR